MTDPDCWTQVDEYEWACYVMYFDDQEHLDFDEVILTNGLIEVTKRCRICGQTDVYYPM